MKVEHLEIIFNALRDSGTRYLVAGGIAVLAHGYVRFTKDLDLVLDLSPDSTARALRALGSLDYRPIIPVPLEDFGRPDLRKDWVENRNMKVFNLLSDKFPDVPIDIFPREPFVFEEEYARAAWREVAPGLTVPVVSVGTLIAMKTEAGRPNDLTDIAKLQRLHGANE